MLPHGVAKMIEAEGLQDAVGGGCVAEGGYAHAAGRWIVRPPEM